MHFSQSVQISLIVFLWGKSYENVSSIRYAEKIYMRCRKTKQVLCRYLKPLGKNINLMIWCLCNHQSDLNYDKMVALLRDSILHKSRVKSHSSNMPPKLLQENSYPAGAGAGDTWKAESCDPLQILTYFSLITILLL